MVIPDGSTDDDPTVKDGRLTPAVEEEHPQPDSNDSGRDSSKRFSIFGSLLQTLVTTASTPELETAAPPTRTPPLKKRSGVDRMSVSDPIAMAFSPTLVPESMRSEVIADSDREDVVEDDDEHWQALFVRPTLHQSISSSQRLTALLIHRTASRSGRQKLRRASRPCRRRSVTSSSLRQGRALLRRLHPSHKAAAALFDASLSPAALFQAPRRHPAARLSVSKTSILAAPRVARSDFRSRVFGATQTMIQRRYRWPSRIRAAGAPGGAEPRRQTAILILWL